MTGREVTSELRQCGHSLFSWRPLIGCLRESFWTITEAPHILLGLDPYRCEGDRGSPQGWHIVWLTGRPVGHYAAFDGHSLEMNLDHDLDQLKAMLRAGGPDEYAPSSWIKWAEKRGFSPPWAFATDYLTRTHKRSLSVSERHVRAGQARYVKTKFPEKKARVWHELENAKGLSKRGRKAEFDSKMADREKVGERLVGKWRREWQSQKKNDAE